MNQPPQQALASRWTRLGGAIIDAIAVSIINIPVLIATGVFDDVIYGRSMMFGGQFGKALLSFAVFVAINGYLLFHKGQTVGKYLLKMKIVDRYGRVPEFGKLILMRYVIMWCVLLIPYVGQLLALGNVLVIFGNAKRCVHDYLAGTWVVKADYVTTEVAGDPPAPNQ
ncbi:MAG: RDD family protein [candidate division Zixibacteria bacterium]|nr:RDD family protein [candidate division Zixibacteria bacterium]